MVEKKAAGLFHISGKDFLSPYEMALSTAEVLNLDKKLIQKVDASIFVQPAKRPAITGFVIEKARDVLGYAPLSFLEAIKKMLL